MSLTAILLVILLLVLVGVLPAWPYSRSWGFAPGGTVGVIVAILVVMLLVGA
jgi:hypothetical protein